MPAPHSKKGPAARGIIGVADGALVGERGGGEQQDERGGYGDGGHVSMSSAVSPTSTPRSSKNPWFTSTAPIQVTPGS